MAKLGIFAIRRGTATPQEKEARSRKRPSTKKEEEEEEWEEVEEEELSKGETSSDDKKTRPKRKSKVSCHFVLFFNIVFDHITQKSEKTAKRKLNKFMNLDHLTIVST